MLMALTKKHAAYLDGLSVTPIAVFSIRKMISVATKSIKVRRSSDNATQDIGFVGSVLDTASLSTFLGSNSGYVDTFYDQSGNGLNAIQTTAANQPRIYNAGTYDGFLVFNGTSNSFKVTMMSMGTPQVGLYMKWKRPSSGIQIVAEASTNYNSNNQSFVFYNDTSAHGLTISGQNTAGTYHAEAFGYRTPVVDQTTLLMDRTLPNATELACWINGASQSGTQLTATDLTGNNTTYDVYIGARAGTSLYADIQLDTMVFYNADTSGTRIAIENIVK